MLLISVSTTNKFRSDRGFEIPGNKQEALMWPCNPNITVGSISNLLAKRD